MAALKRIRRGLDFIYLASGVVGAIFLVAILTLIVLQMLARWTGEVFPGAPDYAGYCMAAASFFAFANALHRGSHIRVSLVLNAVPDNMRRVLETWCFAIGSAIAWYVAWFAYRHVYWSWKFNDISQGQDATPLWIPQLSMVIGTVVLAVCLTDHLIHVLFVGDHRIERDLVDQSHGE